MECNCTRLDLNADDEDISDSVDDAIEENNQDHEVDRIVSDVEPKKNNHGENEEDEDDEDEGEEVEDEGSNEDESSSEDESSKEDEKDEKEDENNPEKGHNDHLQKK